MKPKTIHKKSRLRGELTVPGDKSISHRAIMLGALAEGRTEVHGFLQSADCLSTMACFQSMGIAIQLDREHGILSIEGKGLRGLSAPDRTLDAGNSGTTTRLISGILAGQPFDTRISGDHSLQQRPMKRIIDPLTQMGAAITSEHNNGCLPLRIEAIPHPLHGISYQSPVSSAQVKSCLLFAGMYADSDTIITEPVLSRNHTEIMGRAFGADIRSEGNTCSIHPGASMHGQKLTVPGDISSAAYFIAAALLCQGSEVLVKNVNINETRAGFLKVVQDMGGKITLENMRSVSGEPVADILAKSSPLHGTEISGAIIPTLIDEIPMLAVLCAAAEGPSVIRDAAELRVKESDRIEAIAENLSTLGAPAEATPDGLRIPGGAAFSGGRIRTRADHRIAMAFSVAGLAAASETEIDDPGCVSISFPEFYQTLEQL